MTLPSLDVLDDPLECEFCGAPIRIIKPLFCAECSDRIAMEQRRESGNEYRRNSQIALDLELARRRARTHQASKTAPVQYACVECRGWGNNDGKVCQDCNGTGVI